MRFVDEEKTDELKNNKTSLSLLIYFKTIFYDQYNKEKKYIKTLGSFNKIERVILSEDKRRELKNIFEKKNLKISNKYF